MTIEDVLFKDKVCRGIYSVCSADPMVLEASFIQAKEDKSPLLVEATCNQVNQYGGYTGMNPAAYKKYVQAFAGKTGFDPKRLILGGDHLGTHPFKKLDSGRAMEEACIMAVEFAKAGFTKIHLDASAPCLDDSGRSPEELAALACERSAEMAQAVESLDLHSEIDYVIGTEVPTPGGALEDEDVVIPTSVEDAEKTITLSMNAFKKRGLQKIMEKVIALVVQPGVEFSDTLIHSYDRKLAAGLSDFIKSKDTLVFEAHSTDYQTVDSLKELVDDGFGILKVGPALTFAKRRALFALARMESELFSSDESSNLSAVIDTVMTDNPGYWVSHYRGTDQELHLARLYSLSDRVRYYWSDSRVNKAVTRLLTNLSGIDIPQTLLYEYVPELYWQIREGEIKANPKEIIFCYIRKELQSYSSACGF